MLLLEIGVIFSYMYIVYVLYYVLNSTYLRSDAVLDVNSDLYRVLLLRLLSLCFEYSFGYLKAGRRVSLFLGKQWVPLYYEKKYVNVCIYVCILFMGSSR